MIWLLLVLYQLKHFGCDYPLQGRYMLGKFLGGRKWILPLLAHSAVHGVATFLIALCIKPKSALWLTLFDMVVHFTMDRIKASPDLLGRFKPLSGNEYLFVVKQQDDANMAIYTFKDDRNNQKNYNGALEIAAACQKRFASNVYFWWSLGLDQSVHHLTHYAIIWWLVR